MAEFVERYASFMSAVGEFQLEESSKSPDFASLEGIDLCVARYKSASVGATTDEPKRRERLEALVEAVFAPLLELDEN